jgi:hypothetical protein
LAPFEVFAYRLVVVALKEADLAGNFSLLLLANSGAVGRLVLIAEVP